MVFVERARSSHPSKDAELAGAVKKRVVERVGLGVNRVLVLEPGTLPRTSSGKIRRGEAKRRFLTGTLTPPEPVNALRLAGEVIRSKLSYFRR